MVGRDDDEESIGSESDISDYDAASWETYDEDETDAAEHVGQVCICSIYFIHVVL